MHPEGILTEAEGEGYTGEGGENGREKTKENVIVLAIGTAGGRGGGGNV